SSSRQLPSGQLVVGGIVGGSTGIIGKLGFVKPSSSRQLPSGQLVVGGIVGGSTGIIGKLGFVKPSSSRQLPSEQLVVGGIEGNCGEPSASLPPQPENRIDRTATRQER
ncbi:hypothetical protein, partial [Vibrio vulnificus]